MFKLSVKYSKSLWRWHLHKTYLAIGLGKRDLFVFFH